MAEIEKQISDKKNAIKDSEALIEKYEEQQKNVRNNREFDSLNKEIEYQGLEIQLAEKRIKESQAAKANKQEVLDAAKEKLDDRQKDLELKKEELDEIVEETKREEEILVKSSEEAQKSIDDRLLKAYHRIRGASRNGLGVVPIDRDASAGSFITIPPQKQLDVAARKKIIVDEHSGRLLVDKELAEEETERIDKMLAKELKKAK
jgi:predicted  nucleic acid-binding Zn-ribbon protein